MSAKTYGFTSPFTERYVEQGRAEGRAQGRVEVAAKMILKALDARGITVTSDVHDRIMSCTTPELLESWADRAFTVSSAEELFE